MKLKQITLALAGLTLASQAMAAPVTFSDIETARTANTLRQTWISGASATVYNLFEGFRAGCDATTVSIFTTQAGGASGSGPNVKPGSLGNNIAYACKRSGVVTVLYQSVDGGSVNAFTPHTSNFQLPRVRFVGGTTNPCTASQTYTDGAFTAPVNKGCAAATGAQAATAGFDFAPRKPAGGYSDVDSALFPASVLGGNVAAVGTETPANFGQVFGVAVSTPLYRQMQVSQGIYASVSAANTSDPNFNPVNSPNISSEQYTSIVVAAGGYQSDWTGILGTAGAGKKVILARRPASSGTQAASNAFFLSNPCGSGANALLNAAGVADSNSNFEVFEGSGTSNVKTRLTTASNSTGADNFAIGIMSLENDWRIESATGGQNLYRFIKLDNTHPEEGSNGLAGYPVNNDAPFASTLYYTARNTAVNGKYGFHKESVQYIANSATANDSALITAITTALTQPVAADCVKLGRGLTLNPAGGSVCTVGVEVHKGTNAGNNCAPTQLFF